MGKFIAEIFTDALGRPEIKNMVAVPALVVGMILGLLGLLGIFKMDWIGWTAFMGFGAGLITVSAVADAAIDKGAQ